MVFARWRQCAPHLIHASLAHLSPQPKWHHSAVFAVLTTVTDQQTDRQTDPATRSVTTGRIYIRSTPCRTCTSMCIIIILHNNQMRTFGDNGRQFSQAGCLLFTQSKCQTTEKNSKYLPQPQKITILTYPCWIHQITPECTENDIWSVFICFPIIMAALCNRGAIIFLDCSFFLLSFFFLSSFFLPFFFPRLISAAVDWMSAILLHMAWP